MDRREFLKTVVAVTASASLPVSALASGESITAVTQWIGIQGGQTIALPACTILDMRCNIREAVSEPVIALLKVGQRQFEATVEPGETTSLSNHEVHPNISAKEGDHLEINVTDMGEDHPVVFLRVAYS